VELDLPALPQAGQQGQQSRAAAVASQPPGNAVPLRAAGTGLGRCQRAIQLDLGDGDAAVDELLLDLGGKGVGSRLFLQGTQPARCQRGLGARKDGGRPVEGGDSLAGPDEEFLA